MIESLRYRKNYSGIYIHFPYCIHKCAYCDFYSIGLGKEIKPEQESLFDTYKKEFQSRLKQNPGIKDLIFDTLFIGGGTPSLADLDKLKNLLEYIFTNLSFTQDLEVSIEANPENISKEFLKNIKSIGFNRINVGVQTFHPVHLKQLDRYFDIEKYTSLMETLSSSIIERFGIDLIYGIPGQTEEDFYNDINLALGHGVNHLSAYSLTVEKGTKYSRNIKDKLSSTPDEELQIRILENLPEFLLSKGLNQYEVSNYSFAGMESRHNRKYWTMEYYLALGPGAHGFLPQGRYFNSRSIESYLSGKFGEKYEDGFSLEEFALCIFRNFSPIDMESFFKGLNFSLEGYYELFEKWKREGLCYWDGKIFKWNNKVILNLDNLIFEFVNFKSYLQTN